jgi:hypothetical protein
MTTTIQIALLGFALAGCSLMKSDEGPLTVSPEDQDDDPPPGGDDGNSDGEPDDDGTPAPALPPIEGNCEIETNVIGVYETRPDGQLGGEAHVVVARPGVHRLVLSAYEETNWTVELGADVTIESIHLVGFHEQTVNAIPGATVTSNTYHDGAGTPVCGFYYPADTGGCDTAGLLAFAEQVSNNPVSTFHGCYSATNWTLGADGTVTSDCDTGAGYEVTQHLGACLGGDTVDPYSRWQPQYIHPVGSASCHGQSFVKYDERYQLWLGAIQCFTGYRLYASDSREGTYYELADTAGHGQDHCELVNPDFRIPNEDSIESGGCEDCSIGDLLDPSGYKVYSRANFGEPFQLVDSSFWTELSATYLSCGVSIP